MFSEASNVSAGVDKVFAFIIIVSLFFLVAITAFIIYTLVRFARKKGHTAMQFSDNLKLEILWTIIPTILVLLMFYFGWMAFAPMRKAPDDALRVTAIGRMWEWEFEYSNGAKSKVLVTPVNKPLRLDLKSVDVNHGLFIPAFRVKEDVVPGYSNYMWFIPQYVGEYEILCTQYCGLLHSNMLSKIRVVEEEEFDRWYAALDSTLRVPDPPGLILLRNTGCLACHSTEGSKLAGPPFNGLWKAKRLVTSQGTEKNIVADENYIMRSVFDPDAEIAVGYSKGLMRSYKDLLKKEDLESIIEYLKTLEAAP
jgi:cytochrome c oxidase subunit 2